MHDSWIERLGEEVLKFQLWGQLFLKGLLEDSWACTASGRMPRARLSTNGAVQILEDSWRMDPTRALHMFLRTLSSLHDTSMIQQSNTLILKGVSFKMQETLWKNVASCALSLGNCPTLCSGLRGKAISCNLFPKYASKNNPAKHAFSHVIHTGASFCERKNAVYRAQRTNEYLNENNWKL